jgi:serine/threonine protein kinase/tetratricopeptide (TPR) repeat protein
MSEPLRAEALACALPARFELIQHLGRGGMGSVYEALDRERGTRVALKTLSSFDPGALLYLKNEFRALQDVRHENLVHLLELVEESGRFFVVMELVEGTGFLQHCRPGLEQPAISGMSETREVMRAELRESGARPVAASSESALVEERLRSALGQLTEGLCALHDRGMVHRDIKPQNVLVTGSGRVVLVDFGLAHDVGAQPAQISGTRAFMAPEQAAGQALTSAADWFSFGVMLYLALVGKLPFEGTELQRKKLAGAPRGLELPGSLSELMTLASELLDPDPARRPDGRAVLQRLGLGSRAHAKAAPVSFVGRAAELSQLQTAFERSRRQAVVALVRGDSGLGKSALVREWLARSVEAEPELLVLRGRCYERELVPYKAFDGIVDALSRFLAGLSPERALRLLPSDAWILSRVFPVLSSVQALIEPSAIAAMDPQELRTRAFAALRELFSRLAAETRLVLFIDDLQWADADSYQLLAELLRVPGAPTLCLVATARPLQSGHDPIEALMNRLDAVVRVALLPLPEGDARVLARGVLGPEHVRLADAVVNEAAGHPLFLQSLAEHAKHAGGFQLGAVRLDDAILSRVERVEPGARQLLELISLAGMPLSSNVARHAGQLDQAAFTANLASLRALHLVRTSFAGGREPVEPYHDRIRESLVARLNPAERRQHHEQLARAMQAVGADTIDPRALVHHLEEAGHPQQAAVQAVLGAARAESALAFDQAAELYRVALRLSDGAERGRLSLKLAEALTNAGRAAEAADAYTQTAEQAEPDQRLDYRRRAADHLLRSGHLEQGMAVLANVLKESGDVLPSQGRSLLTTLWQRFRLKRRGLAWKQTPTADNEPELLRRIDAYHAVGVSLALIDPARGSAFQARAVALALKAGEPLRLAPTLLMEAGYRASLGESGLASARQLHHEAERIGELTGDAYVQLTVRLMRGFIAYHAGEFAHAVQELTEMEHAFRRMPGRYFEQAFCHCFRLICMRCQGHLGELSRGFSEWVLEAERRGDRFTEASLRFNLNVVWLARDNPDEALRDLTRVTWIPPHGGYHVQHWYEQQAKNEIDLYTGQYRQGLQRMQREMKALSRSFILRMRFHRSLARWQLGRLLIANVAIGHDHSALREVARLEAKLLAEGVGFAATWAHLLAAGRQNLSGNPEQVRFALSAALASAEQHDLFQCQHAAAHHLARLDPQAHDLGHAALNWAESQRIAAPERLFASTCPGF